MADFRMLPKLRDSLSYLYIEHAVIECDQQALLIMQEFGRTFIPTANLSLLLLGPGITITHAAIVLLSQNGCSVVWVGQDGTKFYAHGSGETHQSRHLIQQAALVSNPESRLKVVMSMYQYRFDYVLDPSLSLEQVRGLEGARMKRLYEEMSKKYSVDWQGRNYDRSQWGNADPINRAFSAANALLNGICHAAIISGGYSPGLGFLHTGRMLSFVYDIADLYKSEFTIPAAFQVTGESTINVERRVRETCRELFNEKKLLQRILPDIDRLLNFDRESSETDPEKPFDVSEFWWQPDMAEKENTK